MRIFSYRNKRLLKKTLLIALAVVLGLLALIACRFIYLGRFVTYDSTGAHLDYSQHLTAERTPEPAPPDEDFSFDTVLDTSEEEDASAQSSRLTGYYITTTMLVNGIDQVRAALAQTYDYNAVMIDVKSIFGRSQGDGSGYQAGRPADCGARPEKGRHAHCKSPRVLRPRVRAQAPVAGAAAL